MRDSEKTIGNLIDKATLTQICYVDNEGYPITKAMLKPREREGIKTFWFSTNTSSNKVRFFKENPKASIWQEGDTMYYPKGVTEPDYYHTTSTPSSRV